MHNSMFQATDTILGYLSTVLKQAEGTMTPEVVQAAAVFFSRLPRTIFDAEALPDCLTRMKSLEEEIQRLRAALWLVILADDGILRDRAGSLADDALRGTPHDMRQIRTAH